MKFFMSTPGPIPPPNCWPSRGILACVFCTPLIVAQLAAAAGLQGISRAAAIWHRKLCDGATHLLSRCSSPIKVRSCLRRALQPHAPLRPGVPTFTHPHVPCVRRMLGRLDKTCVLEQQLDHNHTSPAALDVAVRVLGPTCVPARQQPSLALSCSSVAEQHKQRVAAAVWRRTPLP